MLNITILIHSPAYIPVTDFIIKEKEKKMSFGEINGDIKCNMLCNNELCHFLSIAQNFSAQYSFELYLTN